MRFKLIFLFYTEVFLIGIYPANDVQMCEFLEEVNRTYRGLTIRYLQEFTPLGTAGGIYQ